MSKTKLFCFISFLLMACLLLSACSADTPPEIADPPLVNGNTSGNLFNLGLVVQRDGDPYCYFYANTEDQGRGIYRLHTETGEQTKLAHCYPGSIYSRYLNLYEDWVYYIDNGIYRVKCDGSREELVIGDISEEIVVSRLQIADDTLYYILGNDLYVQPIDATEPSQVIEEVGFAYYEAPFLYHTKYTDYDTDLYRVDMQTDTSTLLRKSFTGIIFQTYQQEVYFQSGYKWLKVKDVDNDQTIKQAYNLYAFPNVYQGQLYYVLYSNPNWEADTVEIQLARCDLDGKNEEILDEKRVFPNRNGDSVQLFITNGYVTVYDTHAANIFCRIPISPQ